MNSGYSNEDYGQPSNFDHQPINFDIDEVSMLSRSQTGMFSVFEDDIFNDRLSEEEDGYTTCSETIKQLKRNIQEFEEKEKKQNAKNKACQENSKYQLLQIPQKYMSDFEDIMFGLNKQTKGVKPTNFQMKMISERSKKYHSLCMIGVTGHGKSSTANTIAGHSNKFKVSASIKSETSETKGIVTNWFGDSRETPLILIDTPGLGDSEGRDTEHIANMVSGLKQIGFVHTFLVVINSEEPRFSEMIKNTLILFEQMFGNHFYKNILLCFTKFSHDKRTLRQREKGLKQTQKQIMTQYTERFQKTFNYDLGSNQFVFIDNLDYSSQNDQKDQETQYDEIEQIKFIESQQMIMDFTITREPFICRDIKEVRSYNENLKQQIEEQKIQHELEMIRLQEEQNQLIELERQELLLIQQETQREIDKERMKREEFKEDAEFERSMKKVLEESKITYEKESKKKQEDIKSTLSQLGQERQDRINQGMKSQKPINNFGMPNSFMQFDDVSRIDYSESNKNQFYQNLGKVDDEYEKNNQILQQIIKKQQQEEEYKKKIQEQIRKSSQVVNSHNDSTSSTSKKEQQLCKNYKVKTNQIMKQVEKEKLENTMKMKDVGDPMNDTLSHRLTKDGTLDYRCKENRIAGIKKDGTPDMRFKKNREKYGL
eukprot:403340739